ncbi:RNA-binding protein [Corallococcus sp. H22C18031201]|uniref:CRTAC1 family protein n=1 Tax=Citreicoccus inhibens TaxID=2849499 RepID=UPI000E72732F|nr:CRTAC1 family protein [Citreicoccus inhibens]MBU8900208.1 CRTAC1 family protein [Citreicoccus inhibens]RJS16376.1 RNA-binding protein [Corallococcus sp. H22C18031201]
MSTPGTLLTRHAARLGALAAVFILYGFARLPAQDAPERAAAVARFHFVREPLPVATPRPPERFIREVNPSLQRIQGWISAVGAAVALHDLDADGLSNDVCYVDTRTDQVIVAPAPGTPARYVPFTLDAAPLAWNGRTMAPMGCLPADLNEDGWADVVVYYWGRTPLAFLQRPGEPGRPSVLSAERFVRQELVPGGARFFTNAATFADMDGDGHPELILGNYFPDGAQLLDVHATEPDEMQDSMTRAFNGGSDHWLRWVSATSGETPSVTFTEVTGLLDDPEVESLVSHGWTLALGAADLDGDGLPELYIANDFGPDRLLHNRSQPGKFHFALLEGRKSLGTPNSKVLGRDSFKGMGVDFGDTNGDGLLDLFVSNISAEFSLFESHFLFESTGELSRMREGVAPYVDTSEERGVARSGWGWDTRFGDFDNDGVLEATQATGFLSGTVDRWPELQELATANDSRLRHPESWPRFQAGDDLSGHQHNPFYVRDAAGRYQDLATDVGLEATDVTRGIATADVDGDGALDLAVANQWAPSYLVHNRAPAPGAFLGLRLLRPVGGDAGGTVTVVPGLPPEGGKATPVIGAAAEVLLPDGRHLVGQVDGGNGHSGKRSPELHFGLGSLPIDTPITVRVSWRSTSGTLQHQQLSLTPGWHTLLLGRASGEVTP